MKNSFGTSVTITLFGESHGPAIGAVIDGLAPGIRIDTEYISSKLELRKPYGKISTSRHEEDDFRIISGVFNGMTTGTPICIIIPNSEQQSADYTKSRGPVRPGHADFTAFAKYHGFEDFRGGGHFSGRITAALVAAGAIAMYALEQKGICIGTHIAKLGGISDTEFGKTDAEIEGNIKKLSHKRFPVISEAAAEEMHKFIENVAAEGDSIGGVLETAVTGVSAGVGEPWFDTLEGVLAHGLFSIPGIKGVQFGGGFDLCDAKGSEYNDAFYLDGGTLKTKTNNNGGINGGISNGMPIIIRTAVKPTPSIYKAQETVDMTEGRDTVLEIKGRHDPAIIHRVRAVADAVTALTICDMLAQRYGTDWMAEAIKDDKR